MDGFPVSPTEVMQRIPRPKSPRVPEIARSRAALSGTQTCEAPSTTAKPRQPSASPTPAVENRHPAMLAAVRIMNGIRNRDDTAHPQTGEAPSAQQSTPIRRGRDDMGKFQPQAANPIKPPTTKTMINRQESLSPDSSFNKIMSDSQSSDNSSSYKSLAAEVHRHKERQKRSKAKPDLPSLSPINNPVRGFVHRGFTVGKTLTQCIYASNDFYESECRKTYQRRADDDMFLRTVYTNRSGVSEGDDGDIDDESDDDAGLTEPRSEADDIVRPPVVVNVLADVAVAESKESLPNSALPAAVLPRAVKIGQQNEENFAHYFQSTKWEPSVEEEKLGFESPVSHQAGTDNERLGVKENDPRMQALSPTEEMRQMRLDIFRHGNDRDVPEAKYAAALKELAVQATLIQKLELEMKLLHDEHAKTQNQLLEAQIESKQRLEAVAMADEQICQVRLEAESRIQIEIQAKEDILEQFQDLKEENRLLKESLAQLKSEISEKQAFDVAFPGLNPLGQQALTIEHLMSSTLLEYRFDIENLKAKLKETTIDKLAAAQAEAEARLETERLKARVADLEAQVCLSRQDLPCLESDRITNSLPSRHNNTKLTEGLNEASLEAHEEKLRLKHQVATLAHEFEAARHEGSIIFHDGNAESLKLRYEIESLRAQLAHSNAGILEQANKNLIEAGGADDEHKISLRNEPATEKEQPTERILQKEEVELNVLPIQPGGAMVIVQRMEGIGNEVSSQPQDHPNEDCIVDHGLDAIAKSAIKGGSDIDSVD